MNRRLGFARRSTEAVLRAMSADEDSGLKWLIVARELLEEHENARLVADTLATWLRDEFGGVTARPVLPAPYNALLGFAIDEVSWRAIAWRLVRLAAANERVL